MKAKGRRYKMAEDSVKRSLKGDLEYTAYRNIQTSKKHPNYFYVEKYNCWKNEWIPCHQAYISTYINSEGSFVKTR